MKLSTGSDRSFLFLFCPAFRGYPDFCKPELGGVFLPPLPRQLIVFAKSPELGRVKTRLQPFLAEAESLRLHRAFVEDTVSLVRGIELEHLEIHFSGLAAQDLLPSGIDVLRQFGADLGERLENAARHAFSFGPRRLIFLGTDSPAMSRDQIRHAFKALESHDIVIGPAEDGGYTLLGLRACYVQLFHKIRWGGSLVLEQTLHRAREIGIEPHLLPLWWDVDRPKDLTRLARKIKQLKRTGKDYPKRTEEVLDALRASSRGLI